MREKEKKIFILTIVVAVSCLFPWVVTENRQWKGTQYSWGKGTFAAAIFLIVLMFLHTRGMMNVSSQLIKGGVIVMGLMVLFFFVEFNERLFSGIIKWRSKYKSASLFFLITAGCTIGVLYLTFNTSKLSSAWQRKRR